MERVEIKGDIMDIFNALLPCNVCGSKPVRYLHGFKCSSCGFDKAGSYNGGDEYNVALWNSYHSDMTVSDASKFPRIKIGDEEWYWGVLNITLYSLGSKEEYEKRFILFKTSKPTDEWFIDKKTGYTCVIDIPRYFSDLEIMDINGIRYDCSIWLNKPKSSIKAYAYACCTSGGFSNTGHPVIYINTLSWKYNNLAKKLITTFNKDFDFYNKRYF